MQSINHRVYVHRGSLCTCCVRACGTLGAWRADLGEVVGQSTNTLSSYAFNMSMFSVDRCVRALLGLLFRSTVSASFGLVVEIVLRRSRCLASLDVTRFRFEFVVVPVAGFRLEVCTLPDLSRELGKQYCRVTSELPHPALLATARF